MHGSGNLIMSGILSVFSKPMPPHFSMLGLVLGIFVHAVWFLLPVAVAAFLLQHAIQGWCPPVPVFRRLGIRAAAEIDAERYALKVLRGDFDEALRTAYGSCADKAARLLESVER